MPYLAPLKTVRDQLRQATLWLAESTKPNPDNIGAASTDYLRLFGLTALGFMWARMAKAVLARQAAGTSRPELDAKLALAKFFNERMLPQAGAHLAKLTSGAETLMALAAEAF